MTVRKRFTRTWHKNTDTEIFPEQAELDLNIYRDMAMMDLKFAIKKLLYDSDIKITAKEIAQIVGLQEGYCIYILKHLLYEKGISIVIKNNTCFYYVDKPKRKIKTREEGYNYKPIA